MMPSARWWRVLSLKFGWSLALGPTFPSGQSPRSPRLCESIIILLLCEPTGGKDYGAMRRVERARSRKDRRGSAEDYLRQQHECVQVREPLGREANIYLYATSAVSASLQVNYHFASRRARGRQGFYGAMRRVERTQSRGDRRGSAEDYLRQQHECIQVREPLGREANIFLCATSAVSASLRANSSHGFSVSSLAAGIGGAMRRVERARSRGDSRGSAEGYSIDRKSFQILSYATSVLTKHGLKV